MLKNHYFLEKYERVGENKNILIYICHCQLFLTRRHAYGMQEFTAVILNVFVFFMSSVLFQQCIDFVFHYRGLWARSIITAQTASPTFTHVYAALVAVINTKVRGPDV